MKILLTTCLVALTLLCHAQIRFSAEELNEDFEVFKTSLLETHPGLNTYFNSEQVERFFDKAESRIENSTNGHVLYRSLLECVSSIRDAHTSLKHPTSWNGFMGMNKLVPYHFIIQEGQVFITKDKSSESKIQAGSELLAINGIDVTTLQNRLNAHTPCDGNVQNFKNNLNGRYFSKRLMYLYPATSTYEMRVQTPSGEEFTTTVEGISEKNLYSNVNTELLSVAIDKEQSVATLTVHSFNYQAIKRRDQEYFTFLEETFKALRKGNIKNLIIDVRNNGGGDNDLAIALYSYISTGSFAYLETDEDQLSPDLTFASHTSIRESWNRSQWSETVEKEGLAGGPVDQAIHDGLNIFISPEQRFQDISKNKFTGRVQVLTNPATFSAASIFAAVCQGNGRAALIGEGTGEACDSFCGGGSIVVTLPNSGIVLSIPYKQATVANARCTGGFGREVKADVSVIPTVKDHIEQRDVVLKAAIARASR